VKAGQRDFASTVQRTGASLRVFFLCGPDDAGVQEAAAEILRLLPDPGERVELSGADLRRDPVRLGDEARSTSLFGETRHIVARIAGDEAHDAVQILIGGTAPPCPVILIATNATDKSRTAKLLADRPDALVAMFYPPDLKAIAASVRTIAEGAGLRIGGELAERIALAAGSDLRIARSEIAKLALYLDAGPERPRTLTPDAIAAIGARTEEDGFGAIVHVVLSGQSGRLAEELRRVSEIGLNPVSILLAFERRVGQLLPLAGKLPSRPDARAIRALVEAEKTARRVFWKDAGDLAEELICWHGTRLMRLVERLAALHRALMETSQNAEMLLAQGLAEVTRAAARAK